MHRLCLKYKTPNLVWGKKLYKVATVSHNFIRTYCKLPDVQTTWWSSYGFTLRIYTIKYLCGVQEALLLEKMCRPLFTVGTFLMTASRCWRQKMKVQLQLQFTSEGDENDQTPYLDVIVMRTNHKILTTVYRKPTFSGQYVKWNSFCHDNRKIDLIKTLTLKALRICSPSLLKLEL